MEKVEELLGQLSDLLDSSRVDEVQGGLAKGLGRLDALAAAHPGLGGMRDACAARLREALPVRIAEAAATVRRLVDIPVVEPLSKDRRQRLIDSGIMEQAQNLLGRCSECQLKNYTGTDTDTARAFNIVQAAAAELVAYRTARVFDGLLLAADAMRVINHGLGDNRAEAQRVRQLFDRLVDDIVTGLTDIDFTARAAPHPGLTDRFKLSVERAAAEGKDVCRIASLMVVTEAVTEEVGLVKTMQILTMGLLPGTGDQLKSMLEKVAGEDVVKTASYALYHYSGSNATAPQPQEQTPAPAVDAAVLKNPMSVYTGKVPAPESGGGADIVLGRVKM